jgi:hypothetical protein
LDVTGRYLVRILAAGWALASATLAGRLAWLWRDGDPVERELRLAEMDPDREVEHWRRALHLRPRTWEALHGLALAAETSGDKESARRLFDQMYAVNRTFGPAWARLNHLARTGDSEAFWPAARQAFQMSHRDRRALFELCWRIKPDGRHLLDHAGTRPPVLFDATRFLMDRDLPAARVAFVRLLDQPYLSEAETNAGRVATAEERRGLGLDLCDLDLDLGHFPQAWEIWQAMGKHGLLGIASGRGFDWRKMEPKGVEMNRAGPDWVLTFSGEQAQGDLAWRHWPVEVPTRPVWPQGVRPRRDGRRLWLVAERGFRGTVTLPGERP